MISFFVDASTIETTEADVHTGWGVLRVNNRRFNKEHTRRSTVSSVLTGYLTMRTMKSLFISEQYSLRVYDGYLLHPLESRIELAWRITTMDSVSQRMRLSSLYVA